ncbi:hypothetical protein M0813_20387 [Anaeramoeba flamelloides]|uniref:Uncharacterized protein n=1 Tax=Anaeramoeba flamelloides TaxID=1746091 RepID=A0ABQ8YLI4_9EUKA|nr:hypothetical protein M0813_20387 [Anaeramoeba flamelloides]
MEKTKFTKKEMKFRMKELDFTTTPSCFINSSYKFLSYNKQFLDFFEANKKWMKKQSLISLSPIYQSIHKTSSTNFLKSTFDQFRNFSQLDKITYNCEFLSQKNQELISKVFVTKFQVGENYNYQLNIVKTKFSNLQNVPKKNSTMNKDSSETSTSSSSSFELSFDSIISGTTSKVEKSQIAKPKKLLRLLSIEDNEYEDRFLNEFSLMKTLILNLNNNNITKKSISIINNLENILESYIQKSNEKATIRLQVIKAERVLEREKYSELEKKLKRRLLSIEEEKKRLTNLESENRLLQLKFKQVKPLLKQFNVVPNNITKILNCTSESQVRKILKQDNF